MTALYKIPFLCLALFFISCGSNGVVSQTNKGVLLDAGYVANIRYQCGETSGISDANGFFSYDESAENCSFYLGINYISVGKEALADAIVTPFELAGGVTTGLELSRIIQSFGTLNGQVLTLDLAKLDLLQDIDLTNSFSVSTKIAATGATAATAEQTKTNLAKYYNVSTGKLLSQTETTTPTKPVVTQPDTTTPPVVPPVAEPTKPTETPTPTQNTGDTNVCPSGAVCQAGDIEQIVCYPGEICEEPEDTTPCFPGTGCNTTGGLSGNITPPQAQTSCLPGADCVLIDNYCAPGKSCNTAQATTQCLPGKPCETNANDCVPGSSCSQVIGVSKTGTNANTATTTNTTTNNSGLCLPGAICTDTTNTNNQNTSTTTNTTNANTTTTTTTPSPTPPSIPSGDIPSENLGCLPGQLC